MCEAYGQFIEGVVAIVIHVSTVIYNGDVRDPKVWTCLLARNVPRKLAVGWRSGCKRGCMREVEAACNCRPIMSESMGCGGVVTSFVEKLLTGR